MLWAGGARARGLVELSAVQLASSSACRVDPVGGQGGGHQPEQAYQRHYQRPAAWRRFATRAGRQQAGHLGGELAATAADRWNARAFCSVATRGAG